MDTPPSAQRRLEQMFLEHGGLLRAQQVREAGLDPHLLTRWLEAGRIERLSRGVYGAIQTSPHPYGELLEVQLRIPYALPCLVSALAFHGLTTFKPPRLYFAIPRNRTFPPLEYPPLERFYYSKAMYAYGQQTQTLEGQTLTLYSAEKTLADLLKYASRLGKEPFFEGLKTYLKRPRPALDTLLEAAQVCRVEVKMRDALELLTYSIET